VDKIDGFFDGMTEKVTGMTDGILTAFNFAFKGF
jgi:hypothetical protein